MASAVSPSDPVVVYDGAASRFSDLGSYLRQVADRRPLVVSLIRTKLKAKHYDSVLGQFWMVLGPILLACVYMFVRAIFTPGLEGAELQAVISHIVAGVFFFQFVSQTLNQGSGSILQNRAMVLNTNLPRLIYPTVSVGEGFMTLLPTMAVLFVVQALLDQPFGAPLLLLPLLVVLLATFTYGIVLLFATLMIYFRDTRNFLQIVTRVWLWVTPIMYTVEEVPEGMRKFLGLNPLFPFFVVIEELFDAQWPSLRLWAWCVAWAVGMLVLGGGYFLARERDLAIRI